MTVHRGNYYRLISFLFVMLAIYFVLSIEFAFVSIFLGVASDIKAALPLSLLIAALVLAGYAIFSNYMASN